MKRSIGSLVVAAALIACASHAIAADMPTKAPKWGSFLTDGYPNAKCGGYFGINTMGRPAVRLRPAAGSAAKKRPSREPFTGSTSRMNSIRSPSP